MASAFRALGDVLGQLSRVVAQVDAARYVARGPAGAPGSIGAHVRHCLDHVAALERAFADGVVDYDARRRGTAIEHDRRAALGALDAACRRLDLYDDSRGATRVTVRTEVDADGSCVFAESTIGRELAFVLSHTIHHCATINVLLSRLGQSGPPRFGFAPSTPVEEAELPCALSA